MLGVVDGACPVPAEFDASVGCIVRDPVSKKKKIVRSKNSFISCCWDFIALTAD